MAGYSAYLNNIYMRGVIESVKVDEWGVTIDIGDSDGFMTPTENDINVTCTLTLNGSTMIPYKRKQGGEMEQLGVAWVISRDSGDSTSDEAWNAENQGRLKVSETPCDDDDYRVCAVSTNIAYGDLSKKYIRTIFTITATVQGNAVAEGVITA
jgi:hypothetical protein